MPDKYFPLYFLTFIITFSATAITEKILLPALKKNAGQPIYTDGPDWHLSKSGTPTFGGIGFLISTLVATGVISFFLILTKNRESLISLLITIVFAFLNAFIGIIDDLRKLKRKNNRGLSPLEKLIFQFITAAIFLAARAILLKDGTVFVIFTKEIDFGLLYYPLSSVLLVGIINFANLTDGIDGLASSVAFAIGISLLFISTALNPEVALSGAMIIGATLGFLIFNIHPAKIFMGDTGSLFLGAMIASSGFMLKSPLIVIPISIVYVIEGASVVLQILSYKLFKKRIFKMSPIHHHLEKCGWTENRICIVGILITFLFSVWAYVFYIP